MLKGLLMRLVCACRPVYVAAVRPQSKHIVVMVDHGASVTDTQLQIARDSALIILNAIDEHDKVCWGRRPLISTSGEKRTAWT